MLNESNGPKIYRCGSLTYTKRHLLILFFWLLWGDFCYTLMEGVIPSIMPLKYKALGASDFEISLLLATLPTAVYSALNPIISFKSDRFRSRWGRRIPFIFFSVPFLVVGLAVMGFGAELGTWLHNHLGETVENMSPLTFTIWFIGIINVLFTIFNTFVTSTFWYLFNDVVPEHLIARFMSWFRVISLLSSSCYSFFIFPHAQTHYTEIMLGAALLYLIGFTLLCLNVKEGEYPPPPAYVGNERGAVAAVKTYLEECHGLMHYWWQWLGSFLGSVGGGMAMFMTFFYLTIGLDLQKIGIMQGSMNIVVAVLVLGTGWLADRYHPIRVVLVGSALSLLVSSPMSIYTWIFWRPGPDLVFMVMLGLSFCLSAPIQACWAMGDPPLLMRMFPRSRYGQFCSVNGVWRSIGGILGSMLAAGFLYIVGQWTGSREEAYRYIPVWGAVFGIPGFLCTIMLYRSWKKYGGDQFYVPPLPKFKTPPAV